VTINSYFNYQQKEPKWHDWELLRHGQIPHNLKPWLLDNGSLTRNMQRNCINGRFKVKVRKQIIKRPYPSESLMLKLRHGVLTLIREVELQCSDTAWVFARTLIPLTTLHGAENKLAHLGERPLGAILFADPTIQRHHVQIACLLPHHTLFKQAQCYTTAPQILWGRRTLFFLANKPLLVNEIFLPTIYRI